ncbi:hypothetical protein V8F33_008884 [Rhypophila sp. PSN 637]
MDPMIVIGEHRPAPQVALEEIRERVQLDRSRGRAPMYNGDNMSATHARPTESMDMPSPASKSVQECIFVNPASKSLRECTFVKFRHRFEPEEKRYAVDVLENDSTDLLDTAATWLMARRNEHRSLDGRRQNLSTENGSATDAGYNDDYCRFTDRSMKFLQNQLYAPQKQLSSQTHTIDNVQIDNVKSKIHESWDRIDLWCLGIMISLTSLTTLVKTPTLVDGRLPTDTILRLVFILGTQPFWSHRVREPAIDGKSTSSGAIDGYLIPLQSSTQPLNHVSCSIRASRVLTVQ